MFKKIMLLASVVALLSGCAAQPIPKETGQLDLTYVTDERAASQNKTIAIVAPSFEGQAQNPNYTVNPYTLATYDFNRSFHASYAAELEDAIASGFQQLVTNKGFTYVGPYDSFDEITYTDKKDTFLAIIPEVDFRFSKSAEQNGCGVDGICRESGRVRVDGEFSFKLVEPLTRQTFLTKRIDLSDLDISEPYNRAYNNPNAQKGLVGMAVGAALTQLNKAAATPGTAPTNVDNTDKALVTAMNRFYKEAMSKMDIYLSAEEIASFSADVYALKKQKRY